MTSAKKSLQTWLKEYGDDHMDHRNRALHKICVPSIFISLVGIAHLIPAELVPGLRAGDALVLLSLIWYARLGGKVFALMLAQLIAALLIARGLEDWLGPFKTWIVMSAVFALAWVGQFYGHHLEGRRPSFFKDLQYLLVGPLWIWLAERS